MRGESARAEADTWPPELLTRVRIDRERLQSTSLPLLVIGRSQRSTPIRGWNRLTAVAAATEQPIEDTARVYYNGLIRRCMGDKYPSLTFRTGPWIVVLRGMCWHTDADWTQLARALDTAVHPTWLGGNYCGGETRVEARLFAAAELDLALPPQPPEAAP